MKNKRLYIFALLCLVIGSGVFSLSSIFRNNLSDFALGFCEGVSIILILGSAIFLIAYFIKKKS